MCMCRGRGRGEEGIGRICIEKNATSDILELAHGSFDSLKSTVFKNLNIPIMLHHYIISLFVTLETT